MTTDPCGDDISRELVERATSGDEAAIEELGGRVHKRTVRIADAIGRRRGLDQHDREELVSDVVLRIYALPPERMLAVRNWPAFLWQVAKNCASSLQRRKIRRGEFEGTSLDQRVGDRGDGETVLRDLIPGKTDVLSEVQFRELRDRVQAYLASLPKEKARVFSLYLEEWLQREIATKMGIPIGTVGVQIMRIRAWIADLLS